MKALYVTVTKTEQGTFQVNWKKAAQSRALLGSVEFGTELQARKLRRLLETGVPAVRAVELAMRRRRRPTIADDPKAASRYGKLGAQKYLAVMTAEQRSEIAKKAAAARWAKKAVVPVEGETK